MSRLFVLTVVLAATALPLVAAQTFIGIQVPPGPRVCGVDQPVHTYVLGGFAGMSSNTLSEQTGSSPVGSIGGASAGFAIVMDTNTDDCNGDGAPGDFDGDYDLGIGGAFFGSSNAWDAAEGCGYDLNVHATSGTATDVTRLPASGSYGVDDTAGPVVVTDPTTGATVSCQTDGGITPETDGNDCLNDWTGFWSQGACAGTGGDDGYWLFVGAQVSENGGRLTAQIATTGTLAADF